MRQRSHSLEEPLMKTEVEASSHRTRELMSLRRIFARTLPVFLAVLAIGVIYEVISDQLLPAPRGVMLALICALIFLSVVAIRTGRFRLRRGVGFIILGVITVAEALSTVALVIGLITGS